MRNQRRLGSLLAGVGLLAIVALTLYPRPQQAPAAAHTPLLCLVCGEVGGADVVLNLLLFLPMAAGLALLGWPWIRVVAVSALLSLVVETAQYVGDIGRDASLSDILTNTASGALGAAVAPRLRLLLAPGPRLATRLSLAGAGVWLGLQVFTAAAMRPWAPGDPLRNYCTASYPTAEAFAGTARTMALDGVALACDRDVPHAGAIRQALRRGEIALETVAETGDPTAGRIVIHLVRTPGVMLLALAQQRRAAVFHAPTAARALKLFSPAIRLSDAFPARPGTPVSLAAGTAGRLLRLSAAHEGGRRSVELRLSPSFGWTLLFAVPIQPGVPLRLVAMLWIGGLILPAAYWAGRSRRRTAWLGVGAVAIARLGPLPDRGLSSEPMRLSFHQRILLILICLGAIPTAAAIVGWGLTIRAATPAAGPREALEEVGATGRALLRTLDTTDLTRLERDALSAHTATLNSAIGRFQRVETYNRYYYAGLGIAVFLLGAAALYASVRLGGHLSRQLSRPIEELIGWTGHIRRMEPLPPDQPRRGAPEFAALRTALREMAAALERGRSEAIEAERLRAFRETARRVAHEMRNPLTPIRLAVAQMARSPSPPTRDAIDVLTAETERLEHLAREFTEFGRLPEGPAAPVDLCELLEELVRTSVPPTMTPTLRLDHETPVLPGHYDPLRRAFANILRNAVEACGGQGPLEIFAAPVDGGALVTIRDHGPGIPAELEDRIFDPYCTGKEGGTGLGLALAKQTFELHQGSVAVEPTRGGGATFVVRLRGL